MSGIDAETKEAVERLKRRLSRYYAHYNPANLEKLDEILVAYDYDADELFDDLTQVYGPEPADDDDDDATILGQTAATDGSASNAAVAGAASSEVVAESVQAPTSASASPPQPLPIKEDSPVPEAVHSVPPSLPPRASTEGDPHGSSSRRQSTSEGGGGGGGGGHVSRSVSQRDRLAAERKALQAEREEFAPLLQEHDSPLPITERTRLAKADLDEKRRVVEALHKQEVADLEDDEHAMRGDVLEEEADSRSVLKSLSRDQRMLAEGVAARRERESQVDRERLERANKEEAARKQRIEEERAFAAAEADRLRRLEELDEKVKAAEEEAARRAAIGYDDHPDVLVVKHPHDTTTTDAEGINQTPPRSRIPPPTTSSTNHTITQNNNAMINEDEEDDAVSAGGVSELTGSNAAEPTTNKIGKAVLSSSTTTPTGSASDGNTVWRQPQPLPSQTPDALSDFHRRPASKKQQQPRTSNSTTTKNSKKPHDFAEGAPGWLNADDDGKVGRKDSFRGDPVVTEEDDDDEEDIIVSRRSYVSAAADDERSVSATSSAIRWAKAAGGGGGGPSSISPAPARPMWRGGDDGYNDGAKNNNKGVPSQPIVWGNTNNIASSNGGGAPSASDYLSPASQRVAMASYAVYQNRTGKVGAATAQELLNRAKGQIRTTTPRKSSGTNQTPQQQYNHHNNNNVGDNGVYDDEDDGAASDNNPAYKMFIADARREDIVAVGGAGTHRHPNNNNNTYNDDGNNEDYEEIIEDYDGGRRSASVVHHHHHRHVVEVIHKNTGGQGDMDMDYNNGEEGRRDRSVSGVSSGDGKHTIQKILQQLSSNTNTGTRRPASSQIRPMSIPRASTPQQQTNEYMFPINRSVINNNNTSTSQHQQRAGSNAGGLYLAPEDFQRYHYPTEKFTPVALLNNNNTTTTPHRQQQAAPRHWGSSSAAAAPHHHATTNMMMSSSNEYERSGARTSTSSIPPPRADNLPDFYQGERPRPVVRDARRPVAAPPPHISSLLTSSSPRGGGVGGYRELKGTPWRKTEGDEDDRPRRGPSAAYHQISPTTGRPLRMLEVATPAPGPDYRTMGPYDEDEEYDHINDDDLVQHQHTNDNDNTNNPRYNRKPRNVDVRARGGNRNNNNNASYGRDVDPNTNYDDYDNLSRTPSVAETVLEVGADGGGDRVLRCAYEEGQMPPSPFIVASHVRGGGGVPPPQHLSVSSSGVNKIYPASYFNDPSRLLEGSDARGANKVGFNRGAFEYGGAAYITTTTTVAPPASPSSYGGQRGSVVGRGISNNNNINSRNTNTNNSTNIPMVTTQQWMSSSPSGSGNNSGNGNGRGHQHQHQLVGSSTNYNKNSTTTTTPSRAPPPASAILLGQSSHHMGVGGSQYGGVGSAPTPFRVTSTKSTPTAKSKPPS